MFPVAVGLLTECLLNIQPLKIPKSYNFKIFQIDEVESLSAARSASANEPSDAIRVVNALLTQIDAIKRFPNVLIMTTSNVTGTIDLVRNQS